MPNLVYLVVTTIILIIGVALITWGTPIGIISPYLLPAIWIGWITIILTIIITVWYYFYVVSGKRRNISRGVEIFLLTMCVLIMLLCITVGVLALLVNSAIVTTTGLVTTTTTTTTTNVVVTNRFGSLVLWGGILCLIAAIGPIITFFLVRSSQKAVVVEEEKTVLLATGVDPLLVSRLEYLADNLKSEQSRSDVRVALSNYLRDPILYAAQAKYLSESYCDRPDLSCPSGYNRDLVQKLELAKTSVEVRDRVLAEKIANTIDTYKRRPTADNELFAQTLLSSLTPTTVVVQPPQSVLQPPTVTTQIIPPVSSITQIPTTIPSTTLPPSIVTQLQPVPMSTTVPTSTVTTITSSVPVIPSRIDPTIINNLSYIRDNVAESEKNRIAQIIADYTSAPDRLRDSTAAFINGYCACGLPCLMSTTQ